MRGALMLASAALAGAFGGATAYGVGHASRAGGLSAWRWMFILEGCSTIISSVSVLVPLPDCPETARWLSAEEKELTAERLRIEGSHGQSSHLMWADAKETLIN